MGEAEEMIFGEPEQQRKDLILDVFRTKFNLSRNSAGGKRDLS
jgi:hypothetical protein